MQSLQRRVENFLAQGRQVIIAGNPSNPSHPGDEVSLEMPCRDKQLPSPNFACQLQSVTAACRRLEHCKRAGRQL